MYIEHKKLVRDKIPDIIKKAGDELMITVLENDDKFYKEVKEKIIEEGRELCSAKTEEEEINEIVDIQELVDILLEKLSISRIQLKKLQEKKNKERGGFKERFFLLWTSSRP